MTYIEYAIEHYEERNKSLDCKIWEEKLLNTLKELRLDEAIGEGIV